MWATGGAVAKRAFEAMMEMRKIDVAKIETAVRGKSNLKSTNGTLRITVETSVKAHIPHIEDGIILQFSRLAVRGVNRRNTI